MTAEAGERFAGLSTEEARRRSRGAAPKGPPRRGAARAPVPFSHRSGQRIEPLISLQWFCHMDELAKPAIEVVERDRVRSSLSSTSAST